MSKEEKREVSRSQSDISHMLLLRKVRWLHYSGATNICGGCSKGSNKAAARLATADAARWLRYRYVVVSGT